MSKLHKQIFATNYNFYNTAFRQPSLVRFTCQDCKNAERLDSSSLAESAIVSKYTETNLQKLYPLFSALTKPKFDSVSFIEKSPSEFYLRFKDNCGEILSEQHYAIDQVKSVIQTALSEALQLQREGKPMGKEQSGERFMMVHFNTNHNFGYLEECVWTICIPESILSELTALTRNFEHVKL